MPCYRQHIIASPFYAAEKFVDLFKRHAKSVLGNGGVVRVIENHGVRPLPEKAKRKYITTDGERTFWNAKFITVVVDISPEGLKEAERILRADEGVIRFHSVRAQTALERFGAKNYKNPYAHIDVPSSLGTKVKTPKA